MAIQSPSRVFMQFGRFITEGLGIGIDQGAQGAEGAVQRLSGGIMGVAEDMRSGLSSILKTAITDFESLGDAVGNVLDSIASKLLDSGISSLVGGLFGGGVVGNDALSSALRGAIPSFAGGGYTWDGPRTGGHGWARLADWRCCTRAKRSWTTRAEGRLAACPTARHSTSAAA